MIAVAVTDLATPNVTRVVELLTANGVTWAPASAPEAVTASVLIAGGFTTVDHQILSRLPALGAILRTGAGYDNLDLPSIRQHNAALIVPRLEGTPAVAEFVFGGIIAIRRGLREGDAAARNADWDFRNRFHGKLLHGSTLGIIGMGRIGRQVARIGAAFGMNVVAWHPWSDRDLGDLAVRAQSLQGLLAVADVLTLHCRLEEGTLHLINAQALAWMKPGAILVNTGRGALVDEVALRDALEAGAIGGAVIDTFEGEPDLTRTPLRYTKALLSPHIAGHTTDSTEAVARFVADTAIAFLEGEPLPQRFLVS
jgi:phosphoglycerate dehydrogenase-like enzyme